MSEPIRLVKFTQKYPPYNVGDVAGFLPSAADSLIGVVAVAHEEPKPSTYAIEMTPLPGGWYDVGGTKIKGKKAAMELLAEFMAASTK